MTKLGAGKSSGPPENYAQRLAEKRKLNSMKNQGPPLGGAPEIPAGKLGVLLPQPTFGEIEPLMEQVAQSSAPASIPMRMPEPPPVQGVGSAYAVNQAQAQGKLGPVSLGAAARQGVAGFQKTGPISPETQELLKNAKFTNENQEGAPEEKTTLQEDLDAADKKIAEASTPDLPIDFAALAGYRNELTTPERRKAIEARLEPLNVTDLILKREVQQVVPVIPGKIEYTLRTFSEREHIWCLQHVYNYPGNPQYVDELLNMYKMTCTLVELNGKAIPDHRAHLGGKDEEVDKDLFEKKYKIIISLPVQMMADLCVQCNWFNERVLKLFSVESLKNG